MFSREKFKKKMEVVHEHFNFKDFIGLSALIFGLLLSNTSLRKTTAHAVAPNPANPPPVYLTPHPAPVKTAKQARKKPAKKRVQKKVSKKKRSKKKSRKSKRNQRKTAARSQ